MAWITLPIIPHSRCSLKMKEGRGSSRGSGDLRNLGEAKWVAELQGDREVSVSESEEAEDEEEASEEDADDRAWREWREALWADVDSIF